MIRTRSKQAAVVLGALAALAAACDSQSPTAVPEEPRNEVVRVCSMELRYAVSTQVPADLQGFDPENSWMIVRDGEYADSATYMLYDTNKGPMWWAAAAPERAGNYTVTVRAPGFREWTQTNVRVNRDPCHVHPVVLYPELVPAA